MGKAKAAAKPITSIRDLTPDARNVNRHTQRGMGMMESSLTECGFGDSLTVDRHGNVISGNGRLEVLSDIDMADAVVVQSDGTRPIVHQRIDLDLEKDEKARKLALWQNRVGEVNYDVDADVLAGLAADGVDLSGLFFDDELAALAADSLAAEAGNDAPLSFTEARQTLAERFGVPPFSVLDARQGYWQDRKRAWLALGIQSELGRGDGVTWGDAPEITEAGLNYYRNQNKNGLLGESE